MNSREKGKRGERQWRDELRANGYAARRGQQFAGSPDSPDVVCDELDWVHFEVKFVERLNVYDAMEQARHDCMGESREQKAESRNSARGKVPIVVHRRNLWPWLVTMSAETFFRVLRGELPPQPKLDSRAPARSAPEGPLPAANGAPALARCCPGEGFCHCRDKQTFRRFPSDSNLRGEFPRDGTGAVRQEPSKTQNEKEQMT